MSGFEQALRLSRRSSFEGVSVGEWARAVGRCHMAIRRSGQVDGAIRHAALVGRVAAPDAATGAPTGLATAFGVACGLSAMFWMLICYGMKVPVVYGLGYPIGALMVLYIVLRSTWRGGRKVEWRGRVYRSG